MTSLLHEFNSSIIYQIWGNGVKGKGFPRPPTPSGGRVVPEEILHQAWALFFQLIVSPLQFLIKNHMYYIQSVSLAGSNIAFKQ
jgi:hypothetical protein